MELLIIIAVGVVIWYWAKSKSGKTNYRRQTKAPSTEQPEIKVTFTTSTFRGGSRNGDIVPRDVGDLVSGGDLAWVLNPKSPLPLTVYNAHREVAEKLKNLLGTAEYWSQKVPDIALLVAQHNLRFKEVDAFVAQHRKRFNSEVTRLISASSEWTTASEKDKRDLSTEFNVQALQLLGVSVGRADFGCLLEGEPSTFTEDDELVRRFDNDSGLYAFYLSALSRNASVVTVKADDYSRKLWESLVDKGLARRGKDISVQHLLEELRLKDLNELLVGVIEKPLGRKAKAIDVALSLSDLDTRLSQRISYREMFQVIPPVGIDIDALTKSFTYASTLASVVQQTYYTAVRTLDAIDERQRESGIYDAWEITNWDNPIPACAAAVCKKYDRLPAERPPFHIGCACQLRCSFKD